MKKLIIIFLFVTSSLQAQTLSDSVQTLWREVFGADTIGIPVDTSKTLPTYQGILFQTSSDTYPIPYSPLYKDTDGLYKAFVQVGDKAFIYYSADLISWNKQAMGNTPRGTIREYDDKLYDAYHKWFGSLCYYYFAISPDGGSNFYDVSLIRQNMGEDVTFIYDQDKFRFYGRLLPPPTVRNITYFESPDFRQFTSATVILQPDAADGTNEFYSMSVIKTDRGYFGLLNVFNRNTDLVSVQLVYSSNGKDNWRRLNNRQEFLIKKNNVQCLYGMWSIIGDEAFINTISGKFNHAESNKGVNKYFTELYRIKLTDLYKFLN